MADKYLNRADPELIDALISVLANTTVAYYKTHGFHWNVEGQNFYSLHLMFEKFYGTLWESMDEIAERIRALGEKTPPSLAELLKKASLKETDTAPAPSIMLQKLRDDYQTLAKEILKAAAIAEKAGDRITENMMTEKATFLEKAAWMLHSSVIS
jgi:starvation-inducible DNA-binding protein